MVANNLQANETETFRLQTYYLYCYAGNFIDIVTILKLIEEC